MSEQDVQEHRESEWRAAHEDERRDEIVQVEASILFPITVRFTMRRGDLEKAEASDQDMDLVLDGVFRSLIDWIPDDTDLVSSEPDDVEIVDFEEIR